MPISMSDLFKINTNFHLSIKNNDDEQAVKCLDLVCPDQGPTETESRDLMARLKIGRSFSLWQPRHLHFSSRQVNLELDVTETKDVVDSKHDFAGLDQVQRQTENKTLLVVRF